MITSTQDSAQSPRIGQRLPAEGGSKIELIDLTVNLPEAPWKGRMVYNLELDRFQIYQGDDVWLTAGSGTITYVQDTEPVAGVLGDFWVDTNGPGAADNQLYIYGLVSTGPDVYDWILYTDPAAAAAQAAADAAQAAADAAQDAADAAQADADAALTSANGKNKVYFQDAKPTGGTYIAGDTWFDTNDGHKVYKYVGSPTNDFVATQYGTNALQDGVITADKLEAVLILVTRLLAGIPGAQRIEMDEDGIRSYDASDDLLIEWDAATGLMTWRSAASGERMVINEDGLNTYTNDPIELAPIVGNFFSACSDGTYVYAVNGSQNRLRKYEIATGNQVFSGFPISGTFTDVATDGTWVYVIGSGADIYKYDAATGAQNTSGFPISGTFFYVVTDSTYVYASSGSSITKYNATTGASVGGGFPISVTNNGLDVGGGNLYVTDGTFDIRKYDASTGTQNLSGFPITGTLFLPATDGTWVYAHDTVNFQIRKYSTSTGVESTTDGFPLDGVFNNVSVDSSRIVTVDTETSDIRLFNTDTEFTSTSIDSSSGEIMNVRSTVDYLGGRFASVHALGHNDFTTLTANETISNTTNNTFGDLTMNFVVSGTSDVVWVNFSGECLLQTAGSTLTIEMLIDGVANATIIRVGGSGVAANTRFHPSHIWRLTGLTAGSHSIVFQGRHGGTATSTIADTETTACYWTSV